MGKRCPSTEGTAISGGWHIPLVCSEKMGLLSSELFVHSACEAVNVSSFPFCKLLIEMGFLGLEAMKNCLFHPYILQTVGAECLQDIV